MTDPATILATIPAPDPERALWTNDPPRSPDELAQRLPHWAMTTLGHVLRLRDVARADSKKLKAKQNYHAALQLAAHQTAALLGYSYVPKDIAELYHILKPIADLAGHCRPLQRNRRYNPPGLSPICADLYFVMSDDPQPLGDLAHRMGRSSSRGLCSAARALVTQHLATEHADLTFARVVPPDPEQP